MITNSEPNIAVPTPIALAPLAASAPALAAPAMADRRRRWMRQALAVLAAIYFACLTVQVFLAGLGVFVDPRFFQRHKAFVHSFGWLDFVLLILAFAGRAPGAIKRLVITVVILVGVQYLTIELRGPLHTVAIGALHPVSAVLLYATALTLTRRTWALAWSPATRS